jgi:SAM-dependent methyltransferase
MNTNKNTPRLLGFILRVIRAIRTRGLVNAIRYAYYDFLFDIIYGTDTTKQVELSNLSIDSENKAYGETYAPARSAMLRDAMKKTPAELTDGGFLDFGCGKGRALILAAEFGFKKVHGVEFSPQLVEICMSNIEKFRRKRKTDTEFEVVCKDASLYDIPAHVDLFYFYNPFSEPVMGKVIENIVASLRIHPRRAYVINLSPHNTAWEDCKYVHLIDEWAREEGWQIFELVVA